MANLTEYEEPIELIGQMKIKADIIEIAEIF